MRRGGEEGKRQRGVRGTDTLYRGIRFSNASTSSLASNGSCRLLGMGIVCVTYYLLAEGSLRRYSSSFSSVPATSILTSFDTECGYMRFGLLVCGVPTYLRLGRGYLGRQVAKVQQHLTILGSLSKVTYLPRHGKLQKQVTHGFTAARRPRGFCPAPTEGQLQGGNDGGKVLGGMDLARLPGFAGRARNNPGKDGSGFPVLGIGTWDALSRRSMRCAVPCHAVLCCAVLLLPPGAAGVSGCGPHRKASAPNPGGPVGPETHSCRVRWGIRRM